MHAFGTFALCGSRMLAFAVPSINATATSPAACAPAISNILFMIGSFRLLFQ